MDDHASNNRIGTAFRSMSPDEKRALVDRYLAAYNAFDLEGMRAMLHPDIEFRNVSGGEVNAEALGTAAFHRLAEQASALFSARRQTVTEFEVTNDGATAHILYEGVLVADLPNGLRAGDTLRIHGRSEFAFLEGRMSRITDYS